MRQFVLSFPQRFRFRLAYDHGRSIAVFGLFVRAVLRFYRRRAEARGIGDGQTGAITFVQRFGSAANLHVHAHVLVLDGVFTAADSVELTFHSLPAPSDRELRELLETVVVGCGESELQPRHQRRAWAELMRRAFGYELLACPNCGGKMVFLACILRRDVIAKILARAGPAAIG